MVDYVIIDHLGVNNEFSTVSGCLLLQVSMLWSVVTEHWSRAAGTTLERLSRVGTQPVGTRASPDNARCPGAA